METSTVEPTAARPIGPWFPLLVLVASLGLLLVAIADVAARSATPWAEVPFWTGLCIIAAPITARLAAPTIRGGESVGLVVTLGVALFLVKLFHSPIGFTIHDEFFHWRTAQDIIRTHHAFSENFLLPVSALYPGLELATSEVVAVTGLPLFAAGTVVLLLGRVVLCAALYWFYREVGGSIQIAGVATAIYMANPNFLFFDALFSYESLAIPLAALALYSIARGQRLPRLSRTGWTFISVLTMAALVTTHHLTTYALIGILVLWVVLSVTVFRSSSPYKLNLIANTVVAGALALLWFVLVARITVHYLAPNFESAANEVYQLIAQERPVSRQLFQSSAGSPATPLWQRIVGVSSSGLILCALPLGWWFALRKINRALAFMLILVSSLYPLSLALRFTNSGWEIANRSSEFLFIGIGFVVAVAFIEVIRMGRWLGTKLTILIGCAALLFLGGVIAGWPPAWRLPGPYLLAADPRSIDLRGITAATWAKNRLGINNRMAADRTDYELMSTYGLQDIVNTQSGGLDTSYIMDAPSLGPSERSLIRRSRLEYVVIDRRLTRGVPYSSPFLGDDPRGVELYGKPVPQQLFTKFDQTRNVSRVFTNGAIEIFDLRKLDRGS